MVVGVLGVLGGTNDKLVQFSAVARVKPTIMYYDGQFYISS